MLTGAPFAKLFEIKVLRFSMKRNRRKLIKPPLQVADFMCRRCRVQATRDDDRICGICKAVGKSVEPERRTTNALRREAGLAAMLSNSIDKWFIEHHLISLNETLMPSAKEK
jgi:hypothetical protein